MTNSTSAEIYIHCFYEEKYFFFLSFWIFPIYPESVNGQKNGSKNLYNLIVSQKMNKLYKVLGVSVIDICCPRKLETSPLKLLIQISKSTVEDGSGWRPRH